MFANSHNGGGPSPFPDVDLGGPGSISPLGSQSVTDAFRGGKKVSDVEFPDVLDSALVQAAGGENERKPPVENITVEVENEAVVESEAEERRGDNEEEQKGSEEDAKKRAINGATATDSGGGDSRKEAAQTAGAVDSTTEETPDPSRLGDAREDRGVEGADAKHDLMVAVEEDSDDVNRMDGKKGSSNPFHSPQSGDKENPVSLEENGEIAQAETDVSASGGIEGVEAPCNALTVADGGMPLSPAASLSATIRPGVSRRSDYPLLPTKAALLIIDVQEYLSSPPAWGTPMTEDDAKNTYLYNVALPGVVRNIESLAESMRTIRDENADQPGSEVVFTYLEALTDDCRDVSLDYKLSGPKLATLPGPSAPATFLHELHPSRLGKGDILVPKTSCSVFNSTNLDYILRNLNIEQLVITGQLTDQCVESACRDAADLGYLVTIVEDACAATSAESHEKGLDGMKGFARIVKTERVMKELEEACREGFVPPVLMKEIAPAAAAAAVGGADSATEPPIVPEPTRPQQPDLSRAIGCAMSIRPASSYSPHIASELNGATTALLRALRYGGVKFVRYTTVDACNSIRCKAAPLDRILSGAKDGDERALDDLVSIAEVCFTGLPSFSDQMIPKSGLDASRVLTLKPDLHSLRVLPYASKTALVMCTAHDQVTGELSPLCTRGLLARVMETAREEMGLAFSVGAQVEFMLFNEGGGGPVDESLFGCSTTLNQQEEFIGDLYDQLRGQEINVELIHAESGPGQLEVVLGYQLDAMTLADNVVMTRETIAAVAREHKMRALFLPKVKEGQAGNGMHLHLSFRDLRSADPGRNAFSSATEAGPGTNTGETSASGLSPRGESFIEGILHRLPALTIPSVNSFRRVGVGCFTGYNVSWAVENKEAPLRVAIDTKTRKATNVEVKLSDSMANIYLELACLLAAGMDGISRGLRLRPRFVAAALEAEGSDNQERHASYSPLPSSFAESLECLRNDDFLLGVMGPELSTGYIALRESEIKESSSKTLKDEVEDAYQRG